MQPCLLQILLVLWASSGGGPTLHWKCLQQSLTWWEGELAPPSLRPWSSDWEVHHPWCRHCTNPVQRELSIKTKLLAYPLICVPTLTYGLELWVMTKWMRRCIQAVEIRFLSSVDGLSLRGRVGSSVIQEGLKVESLLLHMERFQLWWFLHLIRMVCGSLLDVVFQECPTRSPPPPMTQDTLERLYHLADLRAHWCSRWWGDGLGFSAVQPGWTVGDGWICPSSKWAYRCVECLINAGGCVLSPFMCQSGTFQTGCLHVSTNST